VRLSSLQRADECLADFSDATGIPVGGGASAGAASRPAASNATAEKPANRCATRDLRRTRGCEEISIGPNRMSKY
jgi:hypothetical protein